MNHKSMLMFKTQRVLQKLDGDWWRIGLLWLLTRVFRHALALFLVFVPFNRMSAQESIFGKDRFQHGEVLTYKVKWSLFRLGTVVIRQTLLDSADSVRFLVSMDVQSAQGLPFIDVHFINQTVVSSQNSGMFAEDIFSGKDGRDRTTYSYDSATRRITMVDSSNGQLVRSQSIMVECPCYDALNLFMFARQHAAFDTIVVLPTVNDYEVKSTEIRFGVEREDLQVDALPNAVRARKFDGNARWVGKSFAGMRGPFRGWVSDDEAAVPLRAEIEIFLGSIVMELESFERRNWRDSTGIQQAAIH